MRARKKIKKKKKGRQRIVKYLPNIFHVSHNRDRDIFFSFKETLPKAQREEERRYDDVEKEKEKKKTPFFGPFVHDYTTPLIREAEELFFYF